MLGRLFFPWVAQGEAGGGIGGHFHRTGNPPGRAGKLSEGWMLVLTVAAGAAAGSFCRSGQPGSWRQHSPPRPAP